MLDEHLHDLIGRRVVARVEAELLEVLVLADQLRGLVGQEGEEAGEIVPAGRVVQVLDDVELDAALAQDLQRATRLASAGVVVDHHSVHGSLQMATLAVRGEG